MLRRLAFPVLAGIACAAFAFALATQAPTVQPRTLYRLDVVRPVGGELHVFTADHGLALLDCKLARAERGEGQCVRDAA